MKSSVKSWWGFLILAVKYCSQPLMGLAVIMTLSGIFALITGPWYAAAFCFMSAFTVVISSGVDRHAEEVLDELRQVAVESNRLHQSIQDAYAEITATDDNRWVQWWREHHV